MIQIRFSHLLLLIVAFVAIFIGGRIVSGQGQAADPAAPAGPARVDASPVGSGFTFQGYLEDDGDPVDKTACDFLFDLWDGPGAAFHIGGTEAELNIPVEDGIFTIELNEADQFGFGAFNGHARWLEIQVRCPAGDDGAPFTTLEPRQAVSATPYALSLQPGATIKGKPADRGILNLDSGTEGLLVSAIGGDAIRVTAAADNGLDIVSAANDALVVRQSGADGLQVDDVFDNGVEIQQAGGNGIQVMQASGHGAIAATINSDRYGGLFRNNSDPSGGGAGLYALGNRGAAPDLVLGGNNGEAGLEADDGVISSDPLYAGSDIILRSNDNVIITLNDDGNEDDGDFEVHNNAGEILFDVDDGGSVTSQGPYYTEYNGQPFQAGPIAYGSWDHDTQTFKATPNVEAIYRGAYGYIIELDGESYNNSDYVIVVTPANDPGFPLMATTFESIDVPGNVEVVLTIPGCPFISCLTQADFHFVIYKP